MNGEAERYSTGCFGTPDALETSAAPLQKGHVSHRMQPKIKIGRAHV